MSQKKQACPLLCTVAQDAGHGGIARVSQLLMRVMNDMSGNNTRVIEVIRDGKGASSNFDKVRYTSAVLAAHARGKIDWVMYDHIGIARVQKLVPADLRRPYAIFLHSLEVWNELSAEKFRLLREARLRIANSDFTARRVAEVHPNIGDIKVCHLALQPQQEARQETKLNVSFELLKPDERELLSRIKPQSVLIVGRIWSGERHKGHDALLAAWSQILERVPSAQLVMVGGGDDVPRLQSQARAARVEDKVFFTGKVSETLLEAIYAKAALFAMPSAGEGFGLVYLEAMKHKLACIASPADAAREVVEDGVTGFLIAQNDIKGLAQAITNLLENPHQRIEMGERGHQRLIEHFSFESFKKRLTPILEDAFGK